jgi:hypothetical protein
VPNWEKRLSRDPANIRRLSREKEANMRRAGQILDEIEALSPQMPEAATAEFKGCFADLRDEAVLISRRQILHFLLWTLKDGTMRPGMATIQLIEKQIRSENPSIIA